MPSKSPDDHLRRLSEAVDLYLAHRDGDSTVQPDQVIRDNPELRDLLEPMLIESDPRSPQVDSPRYFDDFELLRVIGRGGVGVVYEAHELSLQRRVALKLLQHGPRLTPSHIERFRREAAAAGRLQHEGIAAVYRVGECDGTHFIAMELIDGPNLAQVLGRIRAEDNGTLRDASLGLVEDGGYFGEVAELVARIAEALACAHDNGIVHRDVKPHNVLLGKGANVKLVDFGLAKDFDREAVTRTGDTAGTPDYMSPEQVRGETVDARTDVYSLGVVLYEFLTLRRPFEHEAVHATLHSILNHEATPIRRIQPHTPRDLQTICERATEKERHRRYANARELAADLRRFLRHEPIHATPPTTVSRTLKLVRRHRAISVAVVFATTALLVGIVGTLMGYAEARDNYATAIQAVDQLLVRAHESRVGEDPAALRLECNLYEEALVAYERLLENSDDPELRRKAARAQHYHATAALLLGDRATTLRLLEDAVARQRAFLRDFPADPRAQLDLARMRSDSIELLCQSGDTETASRAFEEAADLLDGILARSPNDVDALRTFGDLCNNRFFLLTGRGFDAAVIEEAIAPRARLCELRPDDTEARGLFGTTLASCGMQCLRHGHNDRAIDYLSRALPMIEQWADQDPARATSKSRLAHCQGALGQALVATGDRDAGFSLIRESVDLYDELIAHYPEVVSYRLRSGFTKLHLVNTAQVENETEAARWVERAAIDLEFAVRRDPDNESARGQLLIALRHLVRGETARAAGGVSKPLTDARRRLRAFQLEQAAKHRRDATDADATNQDRATDLLAGAQLLLSISDVDANSLSPAEVDDAREMLGTALKLLGSRTDTEPLSTAKLRVEIIAATATALELGGDPGSARPMLHRALNIAQHMLGRDPAHKDALGARWSAAYQLAEMLVRVRDHRELSDLAERMPEYCRVEQGGQTLAGEYFVRCMQFVDDDEAIGGDARETLREEYATRSVSAYRAAVDLGLRNLDFLNHPAFDPLRGREDFKAMMSAAQQR